MIKVVSLFDGIACGLTALKRAGIEVGEYHAFEIDKHAIKVAKKNHPEIIYHGSVVNFDFSILKGADLLIGGSPCQGFSIAGKQLAFDDERSKLFFEFVRAKKEIKPKYFLLENVVMKKEYEAAISKLMGCYPTLINSALVSAQNRQRLYWCNWKVRQPRDRGIYLKDVIEDGFVDKSKSWCILEAWNRFPVSVQAVINGYNRSMMPIVFSTSNCTFDEGWRELSINEVEKLQTIAKGYTKRTSPKRAKGLIGNGWTIDVISHIFKELYAPTENQENCDPIFQQELF